MNQPSTEWVDDLPNVISYMNKMKKSVPKELGTPVCSGSSCDLIPEDTVVRRMLYAPKSAYNQDERLHGRFRKTDVRKVVSFIMKPGGPPLYLLDGRHKKSDVS